MSRGGGPPGMAGVIAAVVGLLAFALPGSGMAQAQGPGSIDTTFGGSGVITLASATQLFGVAVQPDGEVLAAGHSNGKVLVERFSASGAVDGTYVGGSGIARAVAITPDGKVVIAGTSDGAMFAQRLTSGLTPDPSFAGGGIATALVGQGGVANGVTVEPDGSVVAAGSVGSYNTRAGVARFAPNGAVQWAEVPGFDQYSLISALAAQPDGKLVFVGRQTPLQVTDALIGRLNPDGSLDSSFGGGVFTYHYPGGGYTSLNAVAIQNDGKIVAAGDDVGGPNAIFARLNPNGSFDPSFGSGGVAALPAAQYLSNNPGAPLGANGVGIAGGGRIVGAGVLNRSGTIFDAAVWALTPAGSPEGTFGANGTAGGPSNQFENCALAIAPDGSLLTAGNRISGFADENPCSINASSSGFVARFVGFGPPPSRSPAALKPAVLTGAAGAIGQTSATLSGIVNPEGLAASYHFEYGTSSRYDSSTPSRTLAPGTTGVPVSEIIRGLAPGTTYHLRLVAGNAAGTTAGQDVTFTTATGPPSARTDTATGVGEVAATLRGTMSSGGLPTTYRFQYGRSTRYGSITSSRNVRGTALRSVAELVKGLKPGSTYHYRLIATNARGSSFGADRTLRTLPPLKLATRFASSYKLGVLERSGLSLTVRCNQACTVTGSLVVSGSTARQLGLGRRSVSIAGGRLSLGRAGSGSLRLTLTGKSNGATVHLTSLQATLDVVAVPKGGGSSSGLSKSVNLVR